MSSAFQWLFVFSPAVIVWLHVYHFVPARAHVLNSPRWMRRRSSQFICPTAARANAALDLLIVRDDELENLRRRIQRGEVST